MKSRIPFVSSGSSRPCGGTACSAIRRSWSRPPPGPGVIFPEFRKEEILSLAARNARLPAGITRHLIPGRVLRLNAPLAWLAGRETTATKQRYLDAAVAQRWREHGVRYYAEPTYL